MSTAGDILGDADAKKSGEFLCPNLPILYSSFAM